MSETPVKNGTLFGVSVGPGDPELMTVKAMKRLEACRVWAVPEADGGDSMALRIAGDLVPVGERELLALAFPMTADRAELARCHRKNAEMISACLDRGEDVAFVCIGDISVYSTFCYIADPLRQAGYAVEMIPGVPSFCAAASALGRGLTTMRRPLHILPGAFSTLDDDLALPGTRVIMKSGRRYEEVRDKLKARGLRAAAVTNCGLPEEKIYPDCDALPDEAGYFTTLIVWDEP